MILVTGGTGLVGSHVLLELVKTGKQVKALRRKNSNIKEVKKTFENYSDLSDELFNKIEWIEGDILDIFSLESILKDVEIIYHCAALVSFDSKQRKNVFQNNVEGTANLVNAALKCGVRRFLHVSSIATLGKYKEESPISESSVWIPSVKNSAYAESKFFSEMEVWRGMAEGLDVVVVNPSVIIGPGKWEKGSSKFFPLVYRGLRFYTTGVTGYVDVRDVAEAIIILTDNKNFDNSRNQKFLLSAQNIEFGVFFSMVAESLHKPVPAIKVSRFLLHLIRPLFALGSLVSGSGNIVTKDTISSATGKKYYDGSKITRLFGFKYRPVINAVQHTAAIYLKEHSNHQA